MDPNDMKVKQKVTKSPMDSEKLKVDNSSMEAEKQQKSKDPNVKVKLTKSTVETEKLKLGNSSMEAEKLMVTKSSMEAAKLSMETTSTQCVKVSVNKDGGPELSQSQTKAATVKRIEKPFDPVKLINKKKEIWRLGVMLDDLWTVYKSEKEDHIDMVIRDIKGDTIQATINDRDIENWRGKLSEGKTYNMNNFKVHANDSGFKYTPHKCRLTFSSATIVKEVQIDGMPTYTFNFCNFAEIRNGKYEPDVLVDAIGVIDSLKKTVTASATKKGNVNFTLRDLNDTVMDCTLWDEYSAEFLKFYSERADDGPAVIILKHAKVKEATGMYPLQLTNVWNGTKIMFDSKIPEISAFINSLPKDVTYPSQSQTQSYSSQCFTQASGGSQYNAHENFIRQGRVVPLGDMTKMKSDTFCVTIATTSHILVSGSGWYYRSCKDCGCKAEGTEPPYLCRKGHYTDDPIIKYKLAVEVYDGNDTAKFVFWDNLMEQLVGLTASTLLKKEQENGYGDPQEYPTEFDAIMERNFAFRVKWTNDWGGQASVLECQDDQKLIDNIKEQLPAAESSVEALEVIHEGDASIADSPPVQKFTQSDIDNFASLDDSILSTPNVSASADTEMSASSHKTPGKRSAPKPIAVEMANLESQFSSTRSGKLIKKEKP